MMNQQGSRSHVWKQGIFSRIVWGLMGIWCVLSPLITLAADPIKIASIYPQSGAGMPATIKFGQALRLAVEEINQQGGILGRPLELLELDSKSSPIGAKEAAVEAIQQRVVAVLGMTPSSFALASAPLLQEAGIVVIGHQTTHPDVTKVGDYIFRACYTDPYQGRVLAQFAIQDLNAKTAVLLVNTSEVYSMGLAQIFENAFTEYGGKVLWQGMYLKENLDFQELLQRVIELKPDVTFVPGHVRDSALVAKQAANMGVRTMFLGGDAWGEIPNYQKDVVKAVEGSYFTAHWHPSFASPVSDHLEMAFRQKYGEELTSSGAALMYDAAMLLADAIRRAQSVDPQHIRDALAATQNFQGATGTITYDEQGDPVNKEAVVLTYQDGRIKFVKLVKP